MKWEVLSKKQIKDKNEIVEVLLKNRGINSDKEREEFLNPTDPQKISLKDFGIKESEVKKAILRIKKALKSQEKVFVYGDYDADGVCATAILWETLFSLGLNVLPYIPERFSEGYGLNIESIKNLKKDNSDLGLIITVDHGIVADKKIDTARDLGIDIIITDHHQPGKIKPKPYSLIHTTQISGSGVSWVFAREVLKVLELTRPLNRNTLELAALGTIADQLPLVGMNRSIVKYGLVEINNTKRTGLLSLFQNSGVKLGTIGTYEIGFVVAPRINAMGRLGHAMESLRLICTKDQKRADELSLLLTKTNLERQRIVEEVIIHARKNVADDKVIVLAHESYHEGIIGLVAGRLVEEFYRPVIILSKNGDIAKASARSVSGFNMIENIRKLEDLIIEGGGHPMAAGFSIKISMIDKFKNEINRIGKELLTEDVLIRKVKIDTEVDFKFVDFDLFKKLENFNPTGYGNPNPTFVTTKVKLTSAKVIGKDFKHLKLKIEKEAREFNGIGFGMGNLYKDISPDKEVDIVYQIDQDSWNGEKSIQLKIKDIAI